MIVEPTAVTPREGVEVRGRIGMRAWRAILLDMTVAMAPESNKHSSVEGGGGEDSTSAQTNARGTGGARNR